jgi:2-polyprenyl-3-methyl-5-hydroxy-6-metoxy-1,4-benzoquinol methylase
LIITDRDLKWLRSYLYYQINKVLAKNLAGKEYHDFLEVGCGGGRWLVYFAKEFGYKVHGFDFSESGIVLAQNATASAKVTADIKFLDIFEYDVRKHKQYDVVFSDGFIEHFEETETVMGILASMVKKNGTFITILPNLSGIHNRLLKLCGKDKIIYKTHKIIDPKDLILYYKVNNCEYIKYYNIGSILPKVIPMPRLASKVMNGLLRGLDLINLRIEGGKISSTYLIIGQKPA